MIGDPHDEISAVLVGGPCDGQRINVKHGMNFVRATPRRGLLAMSPGKLEGYDEKITVHTYAADPRIDRHGFEVFPRRYVFKE